MASAAHSGDNLILALQQRPLCFFFACFFCMLLDQLSKPEALSQQQHENKLLGVQVCIWRNSADPPLRVLSSSSMHCVSRTDHGNGPCSYVITTRHSISGILIQDHGY